MNQKDGVVFLASQGDVINWFSVTPQVLVAHIFYSGRTAGIGIM